MIPEKLTHRPQWVNWKKITRSGKATKIPVQPDGSPASSTDQQTWTTFDQTSDGFSGRGFVFTADDPFIGIDLDGCRNPATGKLDDWAREIVLKLNSYAEVSPSQTGVKIFAIASEPWAHANKTELVGEGYGDKRPGIEIYDRGRYFAVTGKRLEGMHDVRPLAAELKWLAETFCMVQEPVGVSGAGVPPDSPVAERAAKYVAKMDAAVAGQRGHDSLFKVACALVLGFDLSADDAHAIIGTEYNHRCQPQWSDREIIHKINSARKQPGQRGYLRDAKPEQWDRIYVRTGATPATCENEPAKPTSVRSTVTEGLQRYLDQLRDGGGENLITTGIPGLDHAIEGGIAPGELCILAGRPSHGKSAIAMQMLHHITSMAIPAVFISEEMPLRSIAKRTLQYATDLSQSRWEAEVETLTQQAASYVGSRSETFVVERSGSVERACEEIESHYHEHGVRFAVVDYAQQLVGKGRDQREQISNVSKQLTALAKRLAIPILVLSQLNRDIEGRKTFIPRNTDLKESGQLEQDADVIIFGVWPHRIDASNDPAKYQLFVTKNRERNIAAPIVNVTFEPSRQRLVEECSAIEPYHEFDKWSH